MTQLVRTALIDSLRQTQSAHPGLLIQRGWTDFVKTDAENVGKGGKSEHIARICGIQAPDQYRHAFDRWFTATYDATRFKHLAMKIEGRLLIGLTGGGALETGCAVSQTYGMPYLPGSSIKGAVRAWAEKNLADRDAKNYIFGAESDANAKEGVSGEVVFHDAWWIPDSGCAENKNKPFAEEVVTTHHDQYYGSEGKTPASDLDSPKPNAMIGVRGSFLFTLEGDENWLKLAVFMLQKTLSENGIGAKTSAGYGYLNPNPDKLKELTDALSLKLAEHNFVKAQLLLKVNTGEIVATLIESKRVTSPTQHARADKFLEALPLEQRSGRKIREGRLLVEVTVRQTGINMLEILELRPLIEIPL